MPLIVEPLNADTTFLITFRSPHSHLPTKDITILLDPWLTGVSSVLHPAFQLSRHKGSSLVSALSDLERQPDFVIISQDKPDHCHRETLTTLPSGWTDTHTRILAPPAAASKIDSWNQFRSGSIVPLPSFSSHKPNSVLRITVRSTVPGTADGELTIANIPPSRSDLAGLHNAIGITYRPPGPDYVSSVQNTLSVVYTPHGVTPASLDGYINHFLQPIGALPTTALFHCISVQENPWFMGGRVCNGAPSGVMLAEKLKARTWIVAHDGEKENKGLATAFLKCRQFEQQEVCLLLDRAGISTSLRCLAPGDALCLPEVCWSHLKSTADAVIR